MSEASISWSEGPSSLIGRCQAFKDWWLAGLRDLLPPGSLEWVYGQADSKLFLELDGQEVICRMLRTANATTSRIPLSDFGPNAIDDCIGQAGLARSQVVVASVLQPKLFFVRSITVPSAALPALPRILDQDVLHRTPFPPNEIWHGAVPGGSTKPNSGPLDMRHWIIRKDLAEAALAEFRLRSADIDAIAVAEPAMEAVPVINLQNRQPDEPAWVKPVRLFMVAASLASALLGFLAFDWCQSSVLDSLDASLEEMRDHDYARGNRTSRLFALKADVGVLDVWDELSRALPEHTFLSEMSIKEGKVLISGYSANAASLVRLIDDSKIFSGAALTSAITPDAVEHKDRFSISFSVRGRPTRSSNGGSHD